MGADLELLAGTESDAWRLFWLEGATEFRPDEDSRRLAQALLAAAPGLLLPPRYKDSALAGRVLVNYLSSYSRHDSLRADPEPFGPGSLLWDKMGLNISAFTANGAFMLQVMHPTIGTVVGQKSVYRTDTWGRATRDFASVQTWIYGGRAAIEEGYRLRDLHKTMVAVDEEGKSHHALSAEPWAWVALTAFYALTVGERYFSLKPMTRAQEEQAYAEVLQLCRILQVPERMLPPTIEDYWKYFDDMVENTLVDHPVAHDLLLVLNDAPPPFLPAALRPLWRPTAARANSLSNFLIVGTLPPAARRKLGLSWTDADERRLKRIGRIVALGQQTLPERLRYMPIAYKARIAARAGQKLEHALATRPM